MEQLFGVAGRELLGMSVSQGTVHGSEFQFCLSFLLMHSLGGSRGELTYLVARHPHGTPELSSWLLLQNSTLLTAVDI